MFGSKLRELRRLRGVTQKDLAKHLGVSERAVGYYESGQRTPPPDMLEAIADFFQVSVDYLLGRTEQKHNPDQALELESLLKHEMIMFYDEPLDDETKEGLIQFLKLVKQTKEAKKGKKEQ